VDTEGTSGRIVYIETNKRTEDTIEQIYMGLPEKASPGKKAAKLDEPGRR